MSVVLVVDGRSLPFGGGRVVLIGYSEFILEGRLAHRQVRQQVVCRSFDRHRSDGAVMILPHRGHPESLEGLDFPVRPGAEIQIVRETFCGPELSSGFA